LRYLATRLRWPSAAQAQQWVMPVVGFLGGGTESAYASYVDGFRRAWSLPAKSRDEMSQSSFAGWEAGTTKRRHLRGVWRPRFTAGANPVKLGLVKSFNRPGGNLTGVSFLASQPNTKQFDVLDGGRSPSWCRPADMARATAFGSKCKGRGCAALVHRLIER
jgi:putative tryptophan/tyrosine transport system substrate-binding protein